MDKLKYWSAIPPSNKPLWLLRLQFEISQTYSLRGMEDTPEEWRKLQEFVNSVLRSLNESGDINIRSSITSRLATDNGETALVIERNGRDVQIYRLEHNINS